MCRRYVTGLGEWHLLAIGWWWCSNKVRGAGCLVAGYGVVAFVVGKDDV